MLPDRSGHGKVDMSVPSPQATLRIGAKPKPCTNLAHALIGSHSRRSLVEDVSPGSMRVSGIEVSVSGEGALVLELRSSAVHTRK